MLLVLHWIGNILVEYFIGSGFGLDMVDFEQVIRCHVTLQRVYFLTLNGQARDVNNVKL